MTPTVHPYQNDTGNNGDDTKDQQQRFADVVADKIHIAVKSIRHVQHHKQTGQNDAYMRDERFYPFP